MSKKLSEQLKYRLGSDDLDKVVALEAKHDKLLSDAEKWRKLNNEVLSYSCGVCNADGIMEAFREDGKELCKLEGKVANLKSRIAEVQEARVSRLCNGHKICEECSGYNSLSDVPCRDTWLYKIVLVLRGDASPSALKVEGQTEVTE